MPTNYCSSTRYNVIGINIDSLLVLNKRGMQFGGVTEQLMTILIFIIYKMYVMYTLIITDNFGMSSKREERCYDL